MKNFIQKQDNVGEYLAMAAKTFHKFISLGVTDLNNNFDKQHKSNNNLDEISEE